MQFQLPFNIAPSAIKMKHSDKVMLCGSCFTEHIGLRMQEGKMDIAMNPQGILFNPMSIAKCLQAAIEKTVYQPTELFQQNGIWHHWDFHSRFSNTDIQKAIDDMNASVEASHHFLQKADWLILTFGSSYQYFLNESEESEKIEGNVSLGVANCHKVPGSRFVKRMLSITEMQEQWVATIRQLANINPNLKIILTVSPVRHYRDGLVENNWSKARLFELIHTLITDNIGLQYFPAFEIVQDVLRDYRFYESDMVHPNKQASGYVWEQFQISNLEPAAVDLLRKIEEINASLNHKPRFEETEASQKFRRQLLLKMQQLKAQFPYLDYEKEISNLAEHL